jgi:uncharacterized protein
MEIELTSEEVRVLGCLVEKELATPEYYPLSLKGLVSACNQRSNREPVMVLEIEDVADALEQLRYHGLALQSAESARVARYGHNLRGKLHLGDEEAAILCELFLRGPQTPGELRGRASRLRAFSEVADVERVLEGLTRREPALVARLSVRPGHKEHRYAQLLSGSAPVEEPAPARAATPVADAAPRRAAVAATAVPAADPRAVAEPDEAPLAAAAQETISDLPAGERLARLEQELASLRTEVAALRRELLLLRLRNG